jgi:UDP-2,3-diacylglucosamine hydrolase
MRQKSKTDTARKTEFIMDVNEGAVAQVMLAYDGLLHGHTHRPDIHPVSNSSQRTSIKQSIDANSEEYAENTHKTRYVLGDWRVLNSGGSGEKVEAVIGLVVAEDNDADEVANDENFMMVCYTN